MEKMMTQKKFQSLLNVLHIVFTILMIGTGITISGIMLLIGLIGLIPEDSIVQFLDKGEKTASFNLYGLQLEFSEKIISSFTFDKTLVLSLLCLFFGYMFVLLFIIFCVKRLLKSLKNGLIFTVQNSRYIEWIAYGFIVLSLSIKSIQTFTLYLADKLFHLSDFMQKSEWIQSITYQFFGIHWSLLFGGLVIWIIGRTFKYGAFLQEEYDATA